MREYRLAVATVAAALALIVIGGLVHPTGSSMACPDWPLCNGLALPPLRDGVLFEQGHRLFALGVAVMTAVLAALVVKAREDPATRLLALGALALIGVQSALGAITVLFDLPLLASVGHLAVSMAFLAVTLGLAFRLRPPPPVPSTGRPRSLVAAAAVGTFASIVLGAFVRHVGAALACPGLVLCGAPDSGATRLQMAHRLWNWGLAAVLLAAAVRTLRDPGAPRGARALAAVAPVLLVAQGFLGMATVRTEISVPIVSLHLLVGALVLADLVALFLALGPAAARTGAPAHGERPLVPA